MDRKQGDQLGGCCLLQARDVGGSNQVTAAETDVFRANIHLSRADKTC